MGYPNISHWLRANIMGGPQGKCKVQIHRVKYSIKSQYVQLEQQILRPHLASLSYMAADRVTSFLRHFVEVSK